MKQTARSLKFLKDGQAAVVARIDLTGPTRRRLIEMGLIPGTTVRMLGRAPLGDPVRILLRGYTLTLRGPDAMHILITEAPSV